MLARIGMPCGGCRHGGRFLIRLRIADIVYRFRLKHSILFSKISNHIQAIFVVTGTVRILFWSNCLLSRLVHFFCRRNSLYPVPRWIHSRHRCCYVRPVVFTSQCISEEENLCCIVLYLLYLAYFKIPHPYFHWICCSDLFSLFQTRTDNTWKFFIFSHSHRFPI